MSTEPLFTPEQAALIEVLHSGEMELSAPIPENLDLDETWGQLHNLLSIHRIADDLAIRLRPLIGKFLVWAKVNPEFFRRQGYESYDQFINRYVCGAMKLSRSTLLQARRIADNLPELTSAEFAQIGITKAYQLSGICKSSDPSFQVYLEAAKSHTIDGLTKWAEERKALHEGEAQAVVIVIRTNAYIAGMWEEFSRTPEVHSKVESAIPGKILEALIQEGMSWIVPGGYRVHCPHCQQDFSI